MQYRHLEKALAQLMRIKASDIAAFRARLRHLRNIGLPRLPNPGSGQPIDYTRRQALELMIALELEKLGQSPRTVAMNAESIVRRVPYDQYEGEAPVRKLKEPDCYVFVGTERPGYTVIYGLKDAAAVIKQQPDAFLVINVSGCLRRLEATLNKAPLPR
jgi:hypothetical protein